MAKTKKQTPAEQLEAIRDQMTILTDRAMYIVRCSGRSDLESAARSYWYGQIMEALGNGNRTTMTTMGDTVASLEDL